MIDVSNSFKKAIKNDNREIYGYVDVKYENKNYTKQVTQIPDNSYIIRYNGIINGNKLMKKYATLENNYTLLDGSFMLYNEHRIITNGYISDDLFRDINDNTIIIKNNSTSIVSKGITIYFKENLPFDFTVTITDINNNVIVDDVRNNQAYNYQYIFPTELIISTIELNISSIEFPDNRIRIAYIDFNLGDLYEDNELVNFDVTEELDLLGESMPINTCTVKLNNYSDNGNKFDPINPKGLTKYLTNNVTLEPYIGVLTEDNGIEYVKMGTFYLNDWSSDVDGNVTLNGSSLLIKLKELIIHPTSDFFSGSMYSEKLENIINNTVSINTNFLYYSNYWNNQFLENEKLFDYISSIAPYLLYYDNFSEPNIQYRTLYVNRYNILILKALNFSPVDTISRERLVNDVEYITKNKIKELNVKQNTYGIFSNYRSSSIIPTTSHTLTNTDEYLWFKSNNHLVDGTLSLSYSVSSGNATATILGYTSKLICIKITGTIGSVISLSCSGDIADTQNNINTTTFYNNNVSEGDIIDINLSNNVMITSRYLKNVFFGLDKQYQVRCKTMGDPSLVIGDTISIQTRYMDKNDGYKDMIITKQKFTFDGGLQCEIEGVGD